MVSHAWFAVVFSEALMVWLVSEVSWPIGGGRAMGRNILGDSPKN